MKTVPIITANSITGMSGLEKRPVFFVKMKGETEPSLVVKGESENLNEDAILSIQWSSKLMKNVNHQSVNTKIMTRSEIAEFRRFAAGAFAPGSIQARNAVNAYTWVKMPMVRGLSDAEMYADDGSIDVEAIKRSLPKLMRGQFWYDLGYVIASDIFSGNDDRFNDDGWANQGNLMFLDGGGSGITAIGLDTFDPSGQGDGRSILSKVSPNFDMDRSRLGVLVDATKRRAYAKTCTRSVGHEYVRRLKSKGLSNVIVSFDNELLSFSTEALERFFEIKFTDYLAEGIADGSVKLRDYLRGKQMQYARPTWQSARPGGNRHGIQIGGSRTTTPSKALPQGIKDRMTYLGW